MNILIIFVFLGAVVAASLFISVAISFKAGRFLRGWLLTTAIAILAAIITAVVVATSITGFNANAFFYILMFSMAPVAIACVCSLVGAHIGGLLSKKQA